MPVWKRPNVSSAPLWAVLSRFGVTPESWRELPRWIHRAVTAALVGVVLAVVLGPFFGVDGAALVAYALFVVLYVPGWVDGLGRPGRFVARLGVLALTVTYPYYADTLFTIPIFGAFPDVHTGVVMLIYVMMAVGLNVVVGYAGLLDLGYVAFYAIGAYTAASLASTQFAGETASGNAKRYVDIGAIGVDKSLGGIHISVWLLLILAGVLTSMLGVLIGLPTLRLRGDYLAIVTLGFGEILPQIARNGDNLFNTGFNLTNGPQGVTSMDPIGFGSWIHRNVGLPDNYLTAANGDRLFFWTAVVLVLLTIFCSLRLRDSRLGR